LSERFIEIDQPGVVDDFRPEARIQQVHDGMFRAANVGIDRQPVADGREVERPVVDVGIGEAQEIPR